MSLTEILKNRLKPGFTLIEALAVIAIIGILAALSVYTITQAQRQARDTVRKSDVSAIAQGFEARALDKTCTDQSAIGIYPGESILIDDTASNARMHWHKVYEIATNSVDRCNPVSAYFSSIPNDPKTPTNYYYFNLSAKSDAKGEHYRIAAKLEKEPTPEQWVEICRQSDIWHDEFIGHKYAGCGGIINSTGGGTSGGGGVEPGGGDPPPPVTVECNDGVDNDDPEDTLADGNDPGCDPLNLNTDDDETDELSDPGPGPLGFLRNLIPTAYACFYDVINGTWSGCTGGGSGGGGGGGPTACENISPETDPEEWEENNCGGTGGGEGGGTGGEETLLPYNYYIGR